MNTSSVDRFYLVNILSKKNKQINQLLLIRVKHKSLLTFDFGGSFVRLGEISLGVRTGSSPQERRKREDTGNKVAI